MAQTSFYDLLSITVIGFEISIFSDFHAVRMVVKLLKRMMRVRMMMTMMMTTCIGNSKEIRS